MDQQQSRTSILNKIRQALKQSVPVPFPQTDENSSVFTPPQQDIEVEFAENFTKLQGRFSFAGSVDEVVVQLQTLIRARGWTAIYCREEALISTLQQHGFAQTFTADLANCDAAITTCEQLIARAGSIVMSAAQQSGRTVSVYAPVHICIAYTSQLVYDISDALKNIQLKYPQLPSLITLATGPSRTADIEKTLVVGIHGPKEVFCLLVQE
ncbi:lactate utilization protein B/C [Ilyomonas limi]|uniref:Lactate utilization protein B/C n=1 Tax=Ilyomonas limi TaxID=2575867 RepID=A0A4U3KZL1_9BACT|nr:lactate utilization protein [Ilyomonas limi]TKK66587.1 lactate utilization protein B/C [Ilyomonas limi]